MAHYKIRFLTLLLSLGMMLSLTSSTPVHAQLGATLNLSGPIVSETSLEQELQRQADTVLTDLEKKQPNVEPGLFKKLGRNILLRMKQMKILTEIVKTCGPVAATTTVATEVLTDFILAPILAAYGHAAISGVMVAVPWGFVTGAAVVSYELMNLRYGLAKELDVRSLAELDSIRTKILGFDAKQRVSSALLSGVESDLAGHSFDILKSPLNVDRGNAPYVTVAELESMVRESSVIASRLNDIFYQKLDPPLYAALLLRFINQDDKASSNLKSLVEARQPLSEIQMPNIRQHLLEVDNIRKKIVRSKAQIQEQKAFVKAQLNAGKISKVAAKAQKAFLTGEMNRLQKVDHLAIRHEYSLLLAVRNELLESTPKVDELLQAFNPALVDLNADASVKAIPATTGTVKTQTTKPTVIGRCQPLLAAG